MATKIDIKANVQSENKDDTIGEKSLKTLRTYQLGIVYKDKYGRETPVLTNEAASFTIPKRLSDNKNSISTSVRNDAPEWADSYKFFIKETSNEYYNACMDRWYDAEDGNIWLSFPSAERNKIQEDTFIILKKKAITGTTAAVHEEGRYRVIDVRNEAPEFIKIDYEKYGQSTLNVMGGAIPGSNQLRIDEDQGGVANWQSSVFYDALAATAGAGSSTSDTGFVDWPLKDVVMQLEKDPVGEKTGWLDVANMFVDGEMFIQLSKTLPPTIVEILPDGDGDVIIRLAKKVFKPKTEFDGRFFVKVHRDGVINDYIRSVGNTSPSFNTMNSIQYYHIARTRPGSNADTPDGAYWKDTDLKEVWFVDDADRSRAGGGWGAGSGGPWHENSGYGLIGSQSGNNFSMPAGTNQNHERGLSEPTANANLQCTMELSTTVIFDFTSWGFDYSNNSTTNQDFISKITSHGTKFRFKEDPFKHIYKIVAPTQNSLAGVTNGVGILNYSSRSNTVTNLYNKSARLYLKFKTTGWKTTENTEDYYFTDSEADLWPFNYLNEYTQPDDLNGFKWDPTKKGYADYTGLNGTVIINSAAGDAGQLENHGGPTLSSPNFVAGDTFTANFVGTASNPGIHTNTIQIVDTAGGGDEVVTLQPYPAIWETEPREDIGLDIYYEASQAYPLQLSEATNELFAPYGCVVTCDDKRVIGTEEIGYYFPSDTKLVDWGPTGHGGDTILLSVGYDRIGYTIRYLTTPSAYIIQTGGNTPEDTIVRNGIYGFLNNTSWIGLELKFTRLDGSYTTAKITYISAWAPGNIHQGTANLANMSGRVLVKLDRNLNNMNIKLPYFNCYSFGNGVESDRIRDDFNAVRLDKGVKASTVLDEPYEEEQRTNGLIYSGIYNSTSGINNLNQFIAAEKITKDVNPSYGSIQKLKTRDTNLVAFCEDKVLKIIANKDALYNADGQPQLIASNKVLGNVTTFAGEFGISKNPESFASESFRMYFTDRQRGKVLRLSGDGITPISSVGMQDFFADNLKLYNTLTGSFDDRKQEYNLSMINRPVPVPVPPSVTSGGGVKGGGKGGGGPVNTTPTTLTLSGSGTGSSGGSGG